MDALREAQLLSWMGGDAPKFRIIGFANWNCVKGKFSDLTDKHKTEMLKL